ncbi:DUF6517 family protein [Haloarcula sp. S1CR25-12]|uniref:DUF6517 family protein n=1 Tax=Haloarcula saliterrae TaxID=2950534 RepID=A0ABU2FC13_9EURY|nr:DUF6517 family protein [Haloarcula sp. S1CR25-12]MDS0259813.1 DUF6517 family protein [Haloarcula sp. S1CR25-12]
MNRQYAALLAVACAIPLAGCGFITGSEPLAFSASPATASDEAVSETGYEQRAQRTQNVTRNFTVADQTRQVEVTNQLAKYERDISLGPLGSQRAGVFVAVASPEVEVAGQAFNPIEDLSERELLAQSNSQYSAISVGSQVGSENVTTLGQSTAVKKFEGTATLAGTPVDVYVHATKFRHEGDFVVAVGIYPQQTDGEAANVLTLIGSLEHSGSE